MKRQLNLSLLQIVTCSLLALPTFGQGGTWTFEKSSATPRRNEAVAELNGRLYAVGGAAPGSTSSMATVEAFDPLANAWTMRTALPIPTQEAAAAAINGLLYVVGGGSCCFPLNTLQVYDPKVDRWTLKTTMPTPRYSPVAAVLGNKLYVIGGGSGYGADYSGLVEVYDPASDTWSKAPPVPGARGSIAVTVAAGRLYAIGGTVAGVPSAIVEVYDAPRNMWIRKASMPTARYSLTASVVNGFIYAIGGSAGSGSLGAVEIYDPSTDGWKSMPSLPVVRGQAPTMAAATIHGVLYVVDGVDTGVLTVQALTPSLTVSSYSNLVTNGTFDNGVEDWATTGSLDSVQWDGKDAGGHSSSGSLSTTVSSAFAVITPVDVRPGRQYLFTAMWKETNLQLPCGMQELQVYDSRYALASGSAVILMNSYSERQGEWSRKSTVFTAAANIQNPSKVSLLDNCGSDLLLDNVGLFQLTPEIDSFTASESFVKAGSPVVLSWHVTGGDWAYLNREAVPSSGTTVVFPTATTTFTLEVRNSGHIQAPYNIDIPSVLIAQGSVRRSLTVTVCDPPFILVEPESRTISVGQHTALTVNAQGNEASYQWYVGVPPNGIPISGAIASTLTVFGNSVGITDYYVVVSGCSSSVVSNVARVIVSSLNVAIAYSGSTSHCSLGAGVCTAGEPIQFRPVLFGYTPNSAQEDITWDFGDGSQRSVANAGEAIPVNHVYCAPGVYLVKLTMIIGNQILVTSARVEVIDSARRRVVHH